MSLDNSELLWGIRASRRAGVIEELSLLLQTGLDEITGGSPYGASTLAKGDGSRQPSANELDGARYQGKHVAQITAKLARNQ